MSHPSTLQERPSAKGRGGVEGGRGASRSGGACGQAGPRPSGVRLSGAVMTWHRDLAPAGGRSGPAGAEGAASGGDWGRPGRVHGPGIAGLRVLPRRVQGLGSRAPRRHRPRQGRRPVTTWHGPWCPLAPRRSSECAVIPRRVPDTSTPAIHRSLHLVLLLRPLLPQRTPPSAWNGGECAVVAGRCGDPLCSSACQGLYAWAGWHVDGRKSWRGWW
jgi:hypothetical protein